MLNRNYKWWVLLAMSLSLAILFLDQTAVSIALPTMQKDLNANNTEIQWIVNAYLLTTACMVILGGKLGDIFGHKRIFTFGVFIFITASAFTALAHIEIEAIISRAIQGLGAALMIPASNVIIFTCFKDKERGRAMGFQVAIASLFLSMGPLLGGLLTEAISWRWIFWINIPVGLISCFIVFITAPRDKPNKDHPSIDWAGFITSIAALFCLVFALMQTAQWGWTDPTVLSLFVVGIFATLFFIRLEKRHPHPVVDLRLFKDRGFRIGTLILLLIQTNFIARIFAAIFFQTVLGYGVFMAGLLSLPSTIPILFSGPIGGMLRDKYGPRIPVLIGSTLIAVSSMWIAGFAWMFNYWYMMPGFIAFACGAPMVISTARISALSTIAPAERGAATGVSNAARNVGGTFGLAMMSTIIISMEKLHLYQFLSNSHGPLHRLTPDDLSGFLAGTTESTDRIAHLSHDQLLQLHNAATHAYTFGFSFSMIVIGLIGFVGVYLATKLPGKKEISTY